MNLLTFDSTKLGSRRIDSKDFKGQKVCWTEKYGLEGDVQLGDKVEKYGQEFIWSEDHWSAERLEPLRQQGDADADDVLEALDASPSTDVVDILLSRMLQRNGSGVLEEGEKEPINAVANDHELLGGRNTQAEKALDEFLSKYCAVPSWVEEHKLRRGQELFIQHLPAAGLSLFYASLVGGFSAPKIAKVLRATGYLIQGRQKVFRRLNDTGAMIFDCLGRGALQPGQQGWESVLRVRFLHAMVRRRLRKAGYWDAEAWGDAINQEDLAVTQLAFSYNVLVGCELVNGGALPAEDQEAYLHLWRYIGWLIGVREDGGRDWCRSAAKAKAGMESIVLHLLEPDQDSVAVAHHLLSVLAPQFFGMRAAVCRLFLGSPLADALQLPPMRRYPGQTALAFFFMAVVRVYGWLGWFGPVGRCQFRLHAWALSRVHSSPPATTQTAATPHDHAPTGTSTVSKRRHALVAPPPLTACKASKAAWSGDAAAGALAAEEEWCSGTDALPCPSPLAASRCPVLNAASGSPSNQPAVAWTPSDDPVIWKRMSVVAGAVGVFWWAATASARGLASLGGSSASC